MQTGNKNSFSQVKPSSSLKDFVELFWEHKNTSDQVSKITIFPDTFFKLIVEVEDEKIIAYFLTGLWPKEIEIEVPPNTTVFGVKFKVLAPEYVFTEEIASLLQSHRDLGANFWGMDTVDFSSFQNFVDHVGSTVASKLDSKDVDPRKIQLSQMLYHMEGDISAEEVSNQISWSNRQINRYLNKYLGVSLKRYLSIQKCYAAYIQIREGRFFPEKGYYDQAHFIREVKKYTNQTPKELYHKQNDQFVQLKNIPKK